MHMGHYAAINIHKHMMAEGSGQMPNYQTLSPFPSVMGLALGNKAVSYTPDEGTREGEDLMKSLFGKDMGHTSMSSSILCVISMTNRYCSLLELYAPW
jgi:hypothetical protein